MRQLFHNCSMYADNLLVDDSKSVEDMLRAMCVKRRRVWHGAGIPPEELLKPGAEIRLRSYLGLIAADIAQGKASDEKEYICDVSQNQTRSLGTCGEAFVRRCFVARSSGPRVRSD